MNLKLVSLIVVLLIAGAAGVYILNGNGSADGNTSPETLGTNKTETHKPGSARIVATQAGPETAKPGTNITLKCKLRNDGEGPAKNVKVSSQDFERSFSVIGPGEQVEFQVQIYIPTEEEVKKDFGDDATLSNPYFIGGFGVSYTDMTGKHSTNSNNLEIPLKT